MAELVDSTPAIQQPSTLGLKIFWGPLDSQVRLCNHPLLSCPGDRHSQGSKTVKRLYRSLLLFGLSGSYLFGSGCGGQIAEAFIDGLTEYIASTTNAVLEEAIPIKEAIGAEPPK
ncbi:MAG: hypothetical protein AMXMBFR13_36670 [Phycisphaerae bacterium]